MSGECNICGENGCVEANCNTLKLQADYEPEYTNKEGFQAKLETLINRYCLENGSDTPDFILAEYIADCLQSFDKAVARRTEWYRPETESV